MGKLEHVRIFEQGVGAWNKWRSKSLDIMPDLINVDLSKLDLSKFDLSRANLRGADIKRAVLRDATLREANLRGADLIEAKLYNVDLSEANLARANLSRADLRGVNLTGANLFRTNFEEADLEGADLTGPILWETILVNIDLSHVKNLDSCKHSGPSTIDYRTLKKSCNLPEVFLRGCGLSDWEIEATKLHNPNLNQTQITDIVYEIDRLRSQSPIVFYSCFISYGHADKLFARRLHDALQGEGIRCWLDEHQLLPGQDIHDEVDRGIRLWDKLLLCASENSLSSWWVDNEINTAFEKEIELTKQQGSKVRALVPLNLDGYLFSGKWKSGKATEVKSRVAADFSGWETDNQKFEDAFDRLVKSLQAETEGREPPPISKL